MTTATGPQIDADDALALLTEAVTAKGADHHGSYGYATWEGEAPGCIVGHALYGGGVDLATLEYLDRGGSGVTYARDIHTLLPGVTPAACTIFQAAQEVQDDRRPWGHALRAAQDTHAQLAAQDDADAQRHAPEA